MYRLRIRLAFDGASGLVSKRTPLLARHLVEIDGDRDGGLRLRGAVGSAVVDAPRQGQQRGGEDSRDASVESLHDNSHLSRAFPDCYEVPTCCL